MVQKKKVLSGLRSSFWASSSVSGGLSYSGIFLKSFPAGDNKSTLNFPSISGGSFSTIVSVTGSISGVVSSLLVRLAAVSSVNKT